MSGGEASIGERAVRRGLCRRPVRMAALAGTFAGVAALLALLTAPTASAQDLSGWVASTDAGAIATQGDAAAPKKTSATQQYAKPVSSRLNPTGKAINMPVPFKFGEDDLGEIVVLIGTDDSVSVQKSALLEKMTPALDKAATDKLNGLPDQGGLVQLASLNGAGFSSRFDPGKLELVIEPSVDQRATGSLSLSNGLHRRAIDNAQAASPAFVAGYFNLFTSLDHDWEVNGQDARTGLGLDSDSAIRIASIVIENEIAWKSEANGFLCPDTATCNHDRTAGFKRHGSRVVYDLIDPQIRTEFGDVQSLNTVFQTAPEILGVSLEHAPRKLAPNEDLRPSGSSTFRLYEPSDVDVVINGVVVRHMHLRPGNYDLSDIPLQSGANAVELKITGDSGLTKTLAFTTFFDGNLLAEGKDEWAISGGVPSFLEDDDRAYHRDEWIGTAYFRQGITNEVTGEVQLQGDRKTVLGGAGILTALPFGFLSLFGDVSEQDGQIGWAADTSWTLGNTHILVGGEGEGRESFGFGVEYRSGEFRTPGETLADRGDIVFPEFIDTWRFNAAYSFPLTETITGALSGRYSMGAGESSLVASNEVSRDRYGIDLTLASPITTWMNGSLTVGYSNEARTARADDTIDPEFRAIARFYIQPAENTHVSTSYDTLDDSATAAATWSNGATLGRWDASVDASENGRDDRSALTGSVAYSGNRFETRVSHAAGFDGVGWNAFEPSVTTQHSSLSFGTAIAFADGHAAIGPPVRGDGFAIVYPHPSIAGKEITVGTNEDIRAKSDGLGPALVTNVPAYTQSSLPVDVADLPLGYSLGQGGFDLVAPYKGGYALEVGSSYSVSAYGTLLAADGEPIALLTGVASPEGDKTKQVTIFTNGAGRFGAEGLSPGRWIIEMATEGAPTRFVLEIPDGTDGLYKAGTLQPAGG